MMSGYCHCVRGCCSGGGLHATARAGGTACARGREVTEFDGEQGGPQDGEQQKLYGVLAHARPRSANRIRGMGVVGVEGVGSTRDAVARWGSGNLGLIVGCCSSERKDTSLSTREWARMSKSVCVLHSSRLGEPHIFRFFSYFISEGRQ